MRSRTAATVADLMGVDVHRLQGGIRSYRRWVVSELEKASFSPNIVVLNGNTGTGKTKILHQLSEKGYPIIDLEGMASHRGSIFGHIGLEPSNQKKFDAQLVHAMYQYQDAPFVLMEGESRRIGKVSIPDFLYDKKEQSTQLFIHLPKEERIQNILDDYKPWIQPDAFLEAYRRIRKRIHTPIAKQIDDSLNAGSYKQTVQLLLDYYYDPRYEHTAEQYPKEKTAVIHASSTEDAASQVEKLLTGKYKQQSSALL